MKLNNILKEVARKVIIRTSIMACIASSIMLTSCKKDSATQTAGANLPNPETGIKKVNAVLPQGMNYDPADNYFYQNFLNSSGTVTFVGGSNGNFDFTWTNVDDAVSGKGWKGSSGTGGAARDDRKIGYLYTTNTGTLFTGVYGWTGPATPIEYYVVEQGSQNGTISVNSKTIDGHTYYFSKTSKISGTPWGKMPFTQYIDVWNGSYVGHTGNVTLGDHVSNWKANGGAGWGVNFFQIFAAEGYNSSGRLVARVWSNN